MGLAGAVLSFRQPHFAFQQVRNSYCGEGSAIRDVLEHSARIGRLSRALPENLKIELQKIVERHLAKPDEILGVAQ